MATLYLYLLELINILFFMIEERYYRIGEVSRITGLPKSVIRQWEREIPVIKPVRRCGYRYYTKKDVEILLKLKKLIFEDKYSIDGAKEIVLGHKRKSVAYVAFVEFLRSIRKELESILKELGDSINSEEHKEDL